MDVAFQEIAVTKSLRFFVAVATACAAVFAALAHPGSGIVIMPDRCVYFADAGRSVVWKLAPSGVLEAAGPGVHAHWLAISPDKNFVFADHLPYDPATKEYRHGLLKIDHRSGALRDEIPPSAGETGLASGHFLIEIDGPTHDPADGKHSHKSPSPAALYLIRALNRQPPQLVRTKLGSAPHSDDAVIVTFAGARAVHGLASGPDGSYLVVVDDELRKVTRNGESTVLADRKRIDDACPQNGNRESLFGERVQGVCLLPQGDVLICDPTHRRVVRVEAKGPIRVFATSARPWSPVGVAAHADDVYVLEAGFEPPSRNLGPRVVKVAADGTQTILAEVPEREPIRPYR